MGTSKSNSGPGEWQAGVSVFSGRLDPTWTLSAEQAGRLEVLWSKLEAANDPTPPAPPLGYRGAFVRDPQGRRWYAYRGRVVLEAGSAPESRADPERQFESAIIDSAPPEVLPANVVKVIRGN
jgi:hypothetical protein